MSNVPLDLRGASKLNLLGEDDGFLEYQERLHTLIKHNSAGNEGYATGCRDEGNNDHYNPFNSECQGE